MAVLGFVIFLAVVGFCVYAVDKRLRLPVKFASCDEFNAFTAAVQLAQQRVGPADPRRGELDRLDRSLSAFPVEPEMVFWLVRVSAKDLAFMAPFIDEVIAGRGLPRNLPAEYEDRRPAALQGFKTRMIGEGLWPQMAALDGR